jgi:hypothetical protein
LALPTERKNSRKLLQRIGRGECAVKHFMDYKDLKRFIGHLITTWWRQSGHRKSQADFINLWLGFHRSSWRVGRSGALE